MRRIGLWAFFLMIIGVAQGCAGYHLASHKQDRGAGKTIAIPTFMNKTSATYRIEQQVSEAVRREFIERTRFRVTPEPSGDIEVTGIVRSYSAFPIFFDDRGRASAYNIGVELSVIVTESKTGKILFKNEHWTFNEPFELAKSSADFVPEDSAAIERLARRFASSLSASLLQSTP